AEALVLTFDPLPQPMRCRCTPLPDVLPPVPLPPPVVPPPVVVHTRWEFHTSAPANAAPSVETRPSVSIAFWIGRSSPFNASFTASRTAATSAGGTDTPTPSACPAAVTFAASEAPRPVG